MDFAYERSTFYFFWPLVLDNLIGKTLIKNFPLVCKEWRQIFESNERARFIRFLFNPKRQTDLLFLVLGSLLEEERIYFSMFLGENKVCTIEKTSGSVITFSYAIVMRRFLLDVDGFEGYRTGNAKDFASLFRFVSTVPDEEIRISSTVFLKGFDETIYKILTDLKIMEAETELILGNKLRNPWIILQEFEGIQKLSYIEKLYNNLSKINVNNLLW